MRHTIQDSFSHEGPSVKILLLDGSSIWIGHSKNGVLSTKTDDPARYGLIAEQMAMRTYDLMLRFRQNCPCVGACKPDRKPMDELEVIKRIGDYFPDTSDAVDEYGPYIIHIDDLFELSGSWLGT